MSAHLTEEEQLEALQRWWKDNGKNTVAAIVVAVGGYFGFEFWQDQATAQAELASDKYQTLIESVVVAPGQELSETQHATAVALAGELKDEAASGFYGQSAALFMAKMAVEANKLDQAEAELQWVLDQSPESSVALITRLRLARVQAAGNKFDLALATLNAEETGNFAGAYAETRGDILLQQGNTDAARGAYQLALQLNSETDLAAGSALQSKLNDLSVAVKQPMAAAAPEVAQ